MLAMISILLVLAILFLTIYLIIQLIFKEFKSAIKGLAALAILSSLLYGLFLCDSAFVNKQIKENNYRQIVAAVDVLSNEYITINNQQYKLTHEYLKHTDNLNIENIKLNEVVRCYYIRDLLTDDRYIMKLEKIKE